ncbi:FecR family protein [Arcticibacter sp.]|uniref:FecR family protein n=1 Tax=Arcticibacter sp. TaxID=1872630 RepID=UPI00388EBE4E
MDLFSRYKDYDADDFLNDPAFWNWIMKEGDVEDDLFWESFCESFPEKQVAISEAKQEVIRLNSLGYDMPLARVDLLWSRIEKDTALPAAAPRVVRFKRLGLVAAVASILIVSALTFLYLFQSPYKVIKTAYGTRKEVVLPDGSRVNLNSNSELRYSKFDLTKPREVWIQGEAFFQVSHKKNNQKFVVHANDLNVQVIGTTFNVNSREEQTDVILSTGAIRLVINGASEELMLKPGEMVHYKHGSGPVKKRPANVSKYTAWKENYLTFENDSLGYIFDVLRNNYNLLIETKEQEILQKRFTATVQADRPDLLLEGITEAHSLKLTRKKGYMLISF